MLHENDAARASDAETIRKLKDDIADLQRELLGVYRRGSGAG